jgi:hypothetical protein
MLLTAEFIIEHVSNIIEYVPYFTMCNSQCRQKHAGMYNDMECNIPDSYKGQPGSLGYVTRMFDILIKVDISIK